nr:MAG TPA: hypothetical protein [Bacteriophage sp.]
MKKFPTYKICTCPRCRVKSCQIIFDYKYGIYKCTKCGNIHI